MYEWPATAFVHDFIGESIEVPVAIDGSTVTYAGTPTGLDPQGVRPGSARLFVRPYEFAVAPPEAAPITGTVKRVHGIGPARRVEIRLGGDDASIEVDLPRSRDVAIGQPIGLRPERYRIFAIDG